jgi:hypothetical protein
MARDGTMYHNLKGDSMYERKVELGKDYYIDDKGIFRWHSNNNPIPMDACEGYKLPINKEVQKAGIDQHTTAFLTEYRERMKNHEYSEEEKAEMRAAFGPGETVVNIVTGKKIKL